MSFEEKMAKLEEIINKLESGTCGLDDASKMFDEAKGLAKDCYEQLNANKGKITEIVKELDGYSEKLLD